MAVICFVLVLIGLELLSLGMERHARQLAGRALAAHASRVLRILGWCVLAISVLPAVALWGLSIGIAAWCGLLTAAALLLTLALSYRPALAGATLITALVAHKAPQAAQKRR